MYMLAMSVDITEENDVHIYHSMESCPASILAKIIKVETTMSSIMNFFASLFIFSN